jgi:hypothetical protein
MDVYNRGVNPGLVVSFDTIDILGKTALIAAVLSFGGVDASEVTEAETQLWDGTDHLTSLLVLTTDTKCRPRCVGERRDRQDRQRPARLRARGGG